MVAYHGAKSPTDLTRDFVAANVIARGEPLSTLDGEHGNAEAVRLGGKPVMIIENSPFHLHPPPASLPMRLLVPLGFRGASIFWLGLSVVLLGVLAQLLVAALTRFGGQAPAGPTVLFLLLLNWPPTHMNFQLGQWSILLATVIALGFRAWDDGRRKRGAAWLAAAAALKLTPAALFPFVVSRDRRAGAIFAGVLLAALLLALPAGGGLDAWKAFGRDAGTNVAHWQTWWSNTLSLNGLLARLFVGDHFARPLVQAPCVARVLFVAAAGALGFITVAATRGGIRRQRAHDGCVFALWNVLLVVSNPLSWTHCALLLLLPAALIWRAADEPDSPIPPQTQRRLRAAVAVALVVLSIPKETPFLIVGTLPSAPAEAPLLSLHLFAALLLFATAAHTIRALRAATNTRDAG